jgi:diguanylate cyclase (GGDEF)-like protein
MQWSPWRKPQNLVIAAAVAALLGMSWLAFDLSARVATSNDAISALADAEGEGAAPAEAARAVRSKAQRRQALHRLRAQLDEDLLQLKFAIGGAMAGNMLLLLFVVLDHREPMRAAPAQPAARRRDQPGAAGPALFEDMSKLLQSASDYADAYQVVQRCATEVFAGCSGALYIAQEPAGQFELSAQWGQSSDRSSSFAPADCWAIRRGEAYLAAGPADMACAHMRQPPLAPSLCVPVMGQGAALGVLLVEDHAQSGVLESMRAAAKHFAGQIGLALANMKLRETLRNLSVRDTDTGLFNRRYMEESLKREIATAQRKSRPLAVAICELNQFERFKAGFGGDAGDFALREIAQLINKQIRSSDIACRYGKGQIALVFPEAPLEGVVMRTNQLREAVFALDLEHFGRRLDKLSVSFGVALFPQHGKTSAELLRQAEAALAGAKEFGNNRVQIAGAGAKQA